MMKLAILAMALMLWGASSLPYSVKEKKSLYYFPDNDFRVVGRTLAMSMAEGVGSKILRHSGSADLDLLLGELQQFKSLSTVSKGVSLEGNNIVYRIPQAFSIDFDVSYVLTYTFVPMSGNCVFRLTAQDATYKLLVHDRTITPSLNCRWKLDIYNVTNSLALHMGARDVLQSSLPVVEDYFNERIDQILRQEVELYYNDYFGDSNFYIHFPHLRNSSITVAHTFKRHASGTSGNSPVISAFYDESYDPIPTQSSQEEENYLRCVSMDLRSLTSIIAWEMQLTKDVVLTKDAIPPESTFKADLRSVARVLPDVLQEYGNQPVKMTFNGKRAEIGATYDANTKSIKISGITLEVAVTMLPAGQPEVPLFKSVFAVNGQFKPFFYIDPADSKRVYMNLQANTAQTQVISAEKTFANEDAIFYSEAVNDFLKDMVNNFFVRFHRNKILGTGIHITSGFPINHWNFPYTSENGKDLKVYVFPSDS